ncbi:MAG: ceramidase domain-containing protein [Burkholderiales bacterium]|nr:ceramidase domain-containing protein [Burkholderiales bacterium]
MSWSRQVDIYCERVDPAFWAEPVNALTNLAFVAAAAALWRAQTVHGRGDPAARTLALLIGAIGVASFLFHTLATAWAGLADTLAILAFAAYFLYLFLRRAAGMRRAGALALAAAFAAASYFFPALLPAGEWRGSAGYLPYVAALLTIVGYLRARRAASARVFLGATGLFLVSLALRTADPAVCERFPLGTHFAWHLLNAVVLYRLARELSVRLAAPSRLAA